MAGGLAIGEGPPSRGGGSERPAKRGNRGASAGAGAAAGPFAFKALLPDEFVIRRLVQRGGAGIQDIEERTDTHLQLSQRDDYFPGTQLRLVTIHGETPEAIYEALCIVVNEVCSLAGREGDSAGAGGFNLFSDGGDRIVLRCALSRGAAGAVIGAKGDSIKRLRESSGANVKIEREVHDNHQMVTVAGSQDQLLSALSELNLKVQEDVDQPWFSEWAQQRGDLAAANGAGNGAAAASTAGGGKDWGRGAGRDDAGPAPAKRQRREAGRSGLRDHTNEEHTGCTIFIGRLSQATTSESLRDYFQNYGEVADSDVRDDPGTGRSKGFGFITFTSPDAVQAVFADGSHTIDDRRVDVKPYETHGDTAAESGSGEWGGDQAPGGRLAGSSGHATQQEARESIEWFSNLAGSIPAGYLGLEYCIQCALPSSKCGALIGKRGDHIAEVQRVTGASVEVDRKENEQGQRLVSVSGPLMAVYGAHAMLMRYYNDAEAEARERSSQQSRHSENKESTSVEELQRQIAALSREVAKAQSQGGGGSSAAARSTPEHGRGPVVSAKGKGGGAKGKGKKR
eukprot:TRINITY_DN27286_c0_g1_i1.p1 TRINITY_DN27286_c0_g1~~TRINITY_DN27286_c0_g1_i1.p1  ORF type:complete len:590 (-),score=130.71 TRINITY_DN27286_c0_g1_i1:93-1796(-)